MKPFKPRSILTQMEASPCLCSKCRETFHPHFRRWVVDGVPCLSLYRYGDGLRSVIYQYKGCGDIELKSVFLEHIGRYLKIRFKGYVVVPCPSHESHNVARGFNHVESIFESLSLPMVKALRKTEDIKQSSQTKEGRKNIGKYLEITSKTHIKGKKILLVDDIYTTGSTIKACIGLLKGAGAKTIRVLVIAKTPKKGDEGL